MPSSRWVPPCVVLTGLLALLSGPIRGWSSLTVPNSLSSSVPDDVVWLLVFLLAFCLALFTTAAIHGPWWLATLGIWSLALLLGIWSAATTTTRGLTPAVVLAVVTLLADHRAGADRDAVAEVWGGGSSHWCSV